MRIKAKKQEQKNDGKIKPGEVRNKEGKKKGTLNRITVVMKDVILGGGEIAGNRLYEDDQTTHKGLLGFCEWLAMTEPKTYAGLMAKLIPYTIHAKIEEHKKIRYETLGEIQARLRERGIPLREVENMLQLEHMPLEGEA